MLSSVSCEYVGIKTPVLVLRYTVPRRPRIFNMQSILNLQLVEARPLKPPGTGRDRQADVELPEAVQF